MYRNTYLEINLENIKYNVDTLIKRYNNYKYYFGVVKADAYNHGVINVAKTIIKSGINYLCVATLEEGLEIRSSIKEVPILCLGIIDKDYIDICIQNNITITISSLDYIKELKPNNNLKVHIKINTGMNRLGTSSKEELNEIIKTAKQNNFIIEGLYTHIYNPDNADDTNKQFELFEQITKDINLKNIPIIHITASSSTEYYPKKDYVNGCRLGISMYGLVDYEDIKFKSTFSLYSEVIQINEVNNQTVGYNGSYKAKNKELIAVIPIGYADGIIRKNTGRYVYINNKKYTIVGNICMDMLFVKIDDSVKLHDKVQIIKDIDHIKYISNYLDTIPYEVICSISKRVPKIFK